MKIISLNNLSLGMVDLLLSGLSLSSKSYQENIPILLFCPVRKTMLDAISVNSRSKVKNKTFCLKFILSKRLIFNTSYLHFPCEIEKSPQIINPWCFRFTNGSIHFKFIAFGNYTSYFVISEHKVKTYYTEERVVSMLEFLF